MSAQSPQDQPQSQTNPTVPLPGNEVSTDPAAPAAGTVASKPSFATEVTGGLMNLWTSIILIWKGNTVGALRAANSSKSFPLVAFGFYAVIGGLLLATFLSRGLNGLDAFAGDMSYYLTSGSYSSRGAFSVKVGQWFGAFFLGAILFAVVFVIRSLCLKWTFAVRGASQSFDTSSRLVATAYSIPMALLLVATVFFMIPSLVLSGIVMFVVAVASLPVGMIPEILLYVGLNRTHRFSKSPLIPHVSFTLVWTIIVAIAYALIFAIFAEAIS